MATAPTPITINDPVNSTMICERLHIDASALSQWQTRYDTFPAPRIHLGTNTKIWEWADVKDWHKRNRG
jgi:hypothetical protein